jgi:hypothetical protein
VRVSAFHVESGTFAVRSGGSARFTLTAARLEACPVRLHIEAAADVIPCAGVQIGVLDASAEGIVNARTTARFWGSADLLARLQWAPMRWLLAELQGGGSLNLLRHDFYFAPNTSVYTIPALGGFVGAGAGLRFP